MSRGVHDESLSCFRRHSLHRAPSSRECALCHPGVMRPRSTCGLVAFAVGHWALPRELTQDGRTGPLAPAGYTGHIKLQYPVPAVLHASVTRTSQSY